MSAAPDHNCCTYCRSLGARGPAWTTPALGGAADGLASGLVVSQFDHRVVLLGGPGLLRQAGRVARRGLMNDGLDAVDHPSVDHRPPQGSAASLPRVAPQRCGGVVRVNCDDQAAVASVERLKQVGELGPPDLADDDLVRRRRNACRTKSRIVTPPSPSPRASNRTPLARCSHRSGQPARPRTVLNPIARAPARNTGCRGDTLVRNHGPADSCESEHWLDLVPTTSMRERYAFGPTFALARAAPTPPLHTLPLPPSK